MMIGAGAFAIALGVAGYQLQGWAFALVFPALFLIALPVINHAGYGMATERNYLLVFQGIKWALAGMLFLVMLGVKWAFL